MLSTKRIPLPPVTFSIRATTIVVAAVISACGTVPTPTPSSDHLMEAPARATTTVSSIPPLVNANATVQRPKPAAKVETYSVSVRNVPVGELLFALSRDAKLNIDLHPGIEGTVSINAIDQTLQQILTRLSKQVDMRWELNGPNLAIMPDTPFLRTYRIDYVNMSRDMKTKTEVASQVGTTTSGGAGGGSTSIESASKNNFWFTLNKNIEDLLHETDKVLPDGSSETVIERNEQQSSVGVAALAGKAAQVAGQNPGAQPGSGATTQQSGNTVVKRSTYREAASVITNPEAGVITVRATARQHEKVQEFIDQVLSSTRRQVMIEATVVEVLLNDAYDQGINWQSLRELRNPGTAGFSVASRATGLPVPSPFASSGTAFLLNYVAPGLGIAATVSLLETFGNVKVLSSPKMSVLNNQTAIIKVVDNIVYFEVKSDTTNNTNGPSQTTVTTTAKSVAVGLVMSLTPQVSESNTVMLNVRPVISRQNGPGKRDPNPSIPVYIENIVPEISTREMESMLRLTDGEIAVMGGLITDSLESGTSTVPGLSNLPLIGGIFDSRKDSHKKTELVIFLKATIIRDPSLTGDFRGSANQAPTNEFFSNTNGPNTRLVPAFGTTTP